STCMANRSPDAIRPISTSSDFDCIALRTVGLVRLVAAPYRWVHGSATDKAAPPPFLPQPPCGSPSTLRPKYYGRSTTGRNRRFRNFETNATICVGLHGPEDWPAARTLPPCSCRSER